MSKQATVEERVRCIVTHFAALKGNPNWSCRAGEILASDHAAVRQNPHFFAAMDATSEQIRDQLRGIGSYGTPTVF